MLGGVAAYASFRIRGKHKTCLETPKANCYAPSDTQGDKPANEKGRSSSYAYSFSSDSSVARFAILCCLLCGKLALA